MLSIREIKKVYNRTKGVKDNKTGFFATPESIKQELLSLANIDFSDKVIFDPCAGDGSLTRGIKAKKIIQWDLEPRAEGIEQHDALAEAWPEADVIICNPPFTKTKEFYEKAKDCNHIFFITTWAWCKKWLVTRYKQGVKFPDVSSQVCLIYIDKFQDNQLMPLPTYKPFNLTYGQIWKLYKETVFKDAKLVSFEEAEQLQDSHFVTKYIVGGPGVFKKTWLMTKDVIEKCYGDVHAWFKLNKFHRLVAVPKTAYDNFDTNIVIEWMTRHGLKIPENIEYRQGTDCIHYVREALKTPIYFCYLTIVPLR